MIHTWEGTLSKDHQLDVSWIQWPFVCLLIIQLLWQLQRYHTITNMRLSPPTKSSIAFFASQKEGSMMHCTGKMPNDPHYICLKKPTTFNSVWITQVCNSICNTSLWHFTLQVMCYHSRYTINKNTSFARNSLLATSRHLGCILVS